MIEILLTLSKHVFNRPNVPFWYLLTALVDLVASAVYWRRLALVISLWQFLMWSGMLTTTATHPGTLHFLCCNDKDKKKYSSKTYKQMLVNKKVLLPQCFYERNNNEAEFSSEILTEFFKI